MSGLSDMLRQAGRDAAVDRNYSPRAAAVKTVEDAIAETVAAGIRSPRLYKDHSRDAIAKAIKDAAEASANDIERMALSAIEDGERRAAELRKVKQFIIDKGEYMANSAVDFVDFIEKVQVKPAALDPPIPPAQDPDV